jgi:hypothetical protein
MEKATKALSDLDLIAWRKFMLKMRPIILALLSGIWACGSLLAVSPQFWNTDSYAELIKGRLKNLSLNREGQLSLAPSFNLLADTEQALIWGAVADDKTGDFYVGTGHDGKVFKVNHKGELNLFFDAAELDVLALALDNHHNLYAATSPDGKIYRIDSQGKSVVYFDPDDKYIWDLYWNGKDTLYAATGNKGRIYKIDKDGKGDVFFESGQTNLLCLRADADGNLLAGSEPDGYLFRVTAQGKASVLYASSLREIHEIVPASDGALFFAGIGGASAASLFPSRVQIESAPSPAGITSAVGGDRRLEETAGGVPLSLPAPVKLDTGPLKSAIFKLNRNQWVETLWSGDTEAVYSLLMEKSGNLLFSTGQKGRIFRLDPAKKLALLMDTSEEQTTRLISGGEDVYACTSNLARVYRLKSTLNEEGSYESEIKDTQNAVLWGDLQWRGDSPEGTSIQLFTRSGNSRKPDKTWSEWSSALTHAEGEKIKSPTARYLQFKAVLKGKSGKSPLLDRVVVPFLPQNFPPEIKSISILPPGIALQPSGGGGRTSPPATEQGSAEASGAKALVPSGSGVALTPRKVIQKGAQSFQWEVEDRNNDDLVFSVFIKGEKESVWRTLQEELTEKFLTLESDSLPDGKYQIRIQASDSPSNPKSYALTGELLSGKFEIDNTPPQVQVMMQEGKGGTLMVRFKAEDAGSGLRKAEVSWDGKEWETLYPLDGLLDSKSEEFECRQAGVAAGEHSVALRVYDSSGNVGAGKAVVVVKP